MESVGIVLYILLFLAVPALALIVGVEFYLIGLHVRRHHPELYHRFSGYGSYPGSTNHNLMLFVLGKNYAVPAGDDALARRCRRLRILGWTGFAVLFGGAFLAMLFGS